MNATWWIRPRSLGLTDDESGEATRLEPIGDLLDIFAPEGAAPGLDPV